MSKKWLNPPLNLAPATNNDKRSGNLAGHAGSSSSPSAGLLHPANAGSDFHSRRESGLSETQYAIAGLPNHHYMDLPSAVPFQDALTPALPSAEFPSSVRGFVSPPGTSSTTDFPSTSVHQNTYQPSSSPENTRPSFSSIRSELTLHPYSVDPTIALGPPGATALSRADSTVSYNSVWSGEGSNQHFTLDITQFPRPPESDSPSNNSLSPAPVPTSFHPLRRLTRLQPPASPLYEESEPSASRPSTPGALSYRFPVSAPSPSSLAHSTHHADVPLQARSTTSLLVPPSPVATTSVRGSFQSHLTAASRGSSSPRLSIGEDFGRASALPDSTPGWDHVMKSVKSEWNSSDSAINRTSAIPSSAVSVTSIAPVADSSSNSQGGRNTLLVPARPSLITAQSPMSGDSNSDVYSAIGRMSFPKPPPMLGSSGDEPSPISPGTPRSNWVTGVTLKTKNSRGSLGRQGSLKRAMENSPTTPIVPPIPAAAMSYDTPPSAVFDASPEDQSPVDNLDEAAYSSSGKESRLDSPRLEVPVDTRSRASGLSDRAPSYDRRVSDLVRATNQPPERDSVASYGTSVTTDSQRNSVEGAVVGVARTASLSARAKALLTRGPSLNDGSREVTFSYLLPSPLPSAQPSDTSLPLGQSVAPLNLRKNYGAETYSNGLETLQHPPPILDIGHGAFPESVGSSQSFGEEGQGISLQRIQSQDTPQSAVPHSAVPLNQSTPFQNYFSTPTAPTAYRAAKASSPLPPATPNSALSRSGSKLSRSGSKLSRSGSRSKSRHSSMLSTLAQAPSRVAKSISWFRKKPLPNLPPSPPREKREKALPNPDDNLTTEDLAIRAAVMNQYLDVGELPYSSPAPSPRADARGFVHRLNAPRLSVQSVLSSLSDRARGERRRTRTVGFAPLDEPRLESNNRNTSLPSRRRNIIYFIIGFCAILAAAIPIGVVLGRRSQHQSVTPTTCTGGVMTGATCQLNATCVCTSNVAGTCDPVAQALVDLVPPANGLFGMNLTANTLALALWDIQGSPSGNCASQAVLVDVAPALNQTTSPNRTQWARTAILYNLVRTYDLNSTATLRSFVAHTDFSSLQDSPVSNDSLSISTQSAGFVFDFAAMTFSPTSVEWVDNSGVDQTQHNRVGFFADRVLDRMYSFATASSIQRSTALTRYWTKVLQLHEDDVDRFVSAFSAAPVILPFDTSSNQVAAFLANTTSNQGISLPAPIACLPGVSQQGRINLDFIEQNVFGLSSLGASPSTLDSSCFPDRPLYGVLDLLRLRQPFSDSRNSMRIPTAQLISEAAPRVILHSGEQLVGLTGANDNGIATQSNFTVLNGDPREYGTLQHLNHVALSWLQSFPTLTLATQAAQFVLNANDNTLPPTTGNPLYDQTNNLIDFPIVEVTVFGTVLPTDTETFRANFATPNGTLFFGSTNGEAFRQWALRDDGDVILWSESTTAAQVVQEHVSNNTAFETIWAEATGLITAAAAVGRGTGSPELQTTVSALQDAQLFT